MIKNELREILNKIWDVVLIAGFTNHFDAIEQITCFMYIHDLDVNDKYQTEDKEQYGQPYQSIFPRIVVIGSRSFDGRQLRWSEFSKYNDIHMHAVLRDCVFPFLNRLGEHTAAENAEFFEDAVLKIQAPATVKTIVELLDEMYAVIAQSSDVHLYGEVYEYLLSKASVSGFVGQYGTPKQITELLVELVQPQLDDAVCDPACGTAGLLVSAANYVRRNYWRDLSFNPYKKVKFQSSFSGMEKDRTMLRIGAMNMMLHSLKNTSMELRDALGDANRNKEKYTVILSNPTLMGLQDTPVDLDFSDTILNRYLGIPDYSTQCKTKKTELLFLLRYLRLLKNGGRCACIVSQSVLYGTSSAHRLIRRELIEKNTLKAVISLPHGTFRPFTDGDAAILVFSKTGYGGTKSVWFYNMTSDGFSLANRSIEVKDNDIPDIINRFHNLKEEVSRQRTEKSFLVPKEEIAKNYYALSISKYQTTRCLEKNDSSSYGILADLQELGKQIANDLAELEAML